MPREPSLKRAMAFIDGQNLFHGAKAAFGYNYPNYDVLRLAQAVCAQQGWTLTGTRFYVGVPDPEDRPFWHHFWSAKLAAMGRQGVFVHARPLRYFVTSMGPPGALEEIRVGREKGIDVRLALDVVRLAQRDRYDVALVFSQDQDLAEVAQEVRDLGQEENRWIKIASAFPDSPATRNHRGVDKTDWLRIDQATYDACLDPTDYRPKPSPAPEG